MRRGPKTRSGFRPCAFDADRPIVGGTGGITRHRRAADAEVKVDWPGIDALRDDVRASFVRWVAASPSAEIRRRRVSLVSELTRALPVGDEALR